MTKSLLLHVLLLSATLPPALLAGEAAPPAPTMILAGQPFFIFGGGSRRKLLYRNGELLDARTGEVLRRWAVGSAAIRAEDLTVSITLAGSGGQVEIAEDEQGVWLREEGVRTSLTAAPLTLPTFVAPGRDPARAALLRVLHHEILINIVDGKPLPNFMVYGKPWYRDGAMMAMVLARTGNLALIKEWILALREPFDRNNKGQREPDNLGQVLYLVSLVADAKHPVVATVLKEVEACRAGDHITGNSDFAPHPVYQTKWLKYGLRALGLPDPWKIPAVDDSYSALFWMDYRGEHVGTAGFDSHGRQNYPYLGWASDHFYRKPPVLPAVGFPLSWEAVASEADYAGMKLVSQDYAARRISAPHTWHAAEMFLYLIE